MILVAILLAVAVPINGPLDESVQPAVAIRTGHVYQATPLEPPPPPSGVWGLPFAPDGLGGCDEARYYRRQFGLPERFDGITWRESNCKNWVTSSTGCCVGYLQLHYIIWQDHRMVDRLAACGATWRNVRGDDPWSEQRQMCAAAALYSVAGLSPWSATS